MDKFLEQLLRHSAFRTLYRNTMERVPLVAKVVRRGPDSDDVAARVLASGYFDPIFYAQSVGTSFSSDIEAATHYTTFGEAQNYRPSDRFDPKTYRLCNPDLREIALPLILHYADWGAREGRWATQDAIANFQLGQQEYSADRSTVVLAVRDASMVDNALLAAKLASHLSKSFNVVTCLLKDGNLSGEFFKDTILVIKPKPGEDLRISPILLAEHIFKRVQKEYDLDYIIASGADADAAVIAGYLLHVPTLTFAHELTDNTALHLRNIICYSSRVVFPSQQAKLAAEQQFGTKFGHAAILQAETQITTSDKANYYDEVQELLKSCAAIREQEEADKVTLRSEPTLEKAPPGASPEFSEEDFITRYVRLGAAGIRRGLSGDTPRRPLAGFSPHIYATEHPYVDQPPFPNPLADWLRSGRRDGRWYRNVIRLSDFSEVRASRLRIALHIHLHYAELIDDFLLRIQSNQTYPDLFVSVTSEASERHVRNRVRSYGGSKINVRLVPNKGRDIGPMLSEFREELLDYDLLGHLHGKKSEGNTDDQSFGNRWRELLLQNLLGKRVAAIDIIASLFESNHELGLVFPEDPCIVGWTGNFEKAEELKKRVGLNMSLPAEIEFPVGNMFWARPKALAPLFEAAFSWDEYPSEPLARDGTMLHAIERMTPTICESQGFQWITTIVRDIAR